MTPLNYLDGSQISAIQDLVQNSEIHDGVAPLSEHVLLHIQTGGDQEDLHFLRYSDGDLAAYSHLDMTDQVEGPSAEIVVAPQFRGKGIGTSLMREVVEVAGTRLRLWSHGDLPAAAHLAARLGLSRIRTLLLMTLDLSHELPHAPEFTCRSFLPGLDEEAWVAANTRAFAEHPDQGQWTRTDLEIRMNESWFDPSGFFIYEVEGAIAGYCWTKIHGATEHGHPLHGEIYVVGVDPDYRRRGLGKSLTLTGLKYLQRKDLHLATLYVDANDSAAVNLYRNLGFMESGRDVLYRAKPDQINR